MPPSIENPITETSAAKFDSWAIVELMGHQTTAGRVQEVTLAGAGFLRVDVPDVTRRRSTFDYAAGQSRVTETEIPAYTRYIAPSALYALTPCSEAIAREAAASYGCEPPVALALPERTLLEVEKEKGGVEIDEEAFLRP